MRARTAPKPRQRFRRRSYRLILRQDLTSFIERSFYELHPGHQLDLAPHIEVIATQLEAVVAAKLNASSSTCRPVI